MRLVRFGIGYRFCEMKDVEKTKRASVHFMSNGRHGGCMSRLDNFTYLGLVVDYPTRF